MNTIPPTVWSWDGEVMIPRHPRVADRHFVIGQDYVLVEHQDRSTATHNHEFAFVGEAWRNLPENLAEDYPTAEHLRKRALIQAGFFHEMVVDAGSNAAAIRVAAGFRKMDDFAYVVVRGPLVAVRTAKSQSRRAMNKQEFAASKAAILDIISDMLGVEPGDLDTARAA